MTNDSRTTFARWGFLAAATACLALIVVGATIAFNGTSASVPPKVLPGRVEHVAGTDASRVILTAAAVQRIGVTTQPVRDEQVAGAAREVIPYAAVLYDAAGDTWTYTNPESMVYVRARITVDSIEGDRATLSSGPAAGTPVVDVGAVELYGTEFGVSGDE
jgi:hypothetical protein